MGVVGGNGGIVLYFIFFTEEFLLGNFHGGFLKLSDMQVDDTLY